jgi:EAL domain-containing protein (putative c-di-GMP-specific phosphodiesterase class I)
VVDGLRARVESLPELGHSVALDDFGAGYAGLTSFAQLQPDIVKFALELIWDIDRESTKARLVKSMINVCSEMGVITLAEGVETESELSTLLAMGCDLFQGYLLAKPAPEIPNSGTTSPSI